MLEKINTPKDLKELSSEQLNLLCQDIRDLIIKDISLKGGHLASSLGAVEICVALQYCLNTPQDTVIYDVGHQTYAHKIITGRKNMFSKLREEKGLSGFPNYEESEYDSYISGHASTAVSWAQGMADAKKLKGENSKTVAVIGDGSLTGGMCFEALNHCGHAQTDVLVVLNHNEMSISSSVGALSGYLNKMISQPIYNRIRDELESFLERMPDFAKKLAHGAKKFEESMKGLIVPGIFFEELGFRYFGPLDGHDFNRMIPVLKNVLEIKGPKVLHLITKKGKGYKFAEENAENFHSAKAFSVETGKFSSSKKDSFSTAFAKKLSDMADKNKNIVAITAAMIQGTGLDIFETKHKDKLFDVGIAEEHAVGLASGFAKMGLRPFVAIYSTFLQRGFDQIIHDVALQNIPVTFCLDRAGLVGEDGPTHHGVFDISYLRMIPRMICMAPKDKKELEKMLEFSLSLDFPNSIRYPKGEAYSISDCSKIELGKSEILAEGEKVCLMAIGSMVKPSFDAVKQLKQQSIDIMCVNARFIKPLDEELLLSLIEKKIKHLVTVEENVLSGGFGSAVVEFYEQKGLLDKIKIKRIGIADEFSKFASRKNLFVHYGLDSKSLVKTVKEIIK